MYWYLVGTAFFDHRDWIGPSLVLQWYCIGTALVLHSLGQYYWNRTGVAAVHEYCSCTALGRCWLMQGYRTCTTLLVLR